MPYQTLELVGHALACPLRVVRLYRDSPYGTTRMSLELKPKKWAGAIREVTLGSGSRRPVAVGGGNGLPLHTFEASFPHRPVFALEITDVAPPRWIETVRQPWNGVLGQPAAAARRAVDEFGE